MSAQEYYSSLPPQPQSYPLTPAQTLPQQSFPPLPPTPPATNSSSPKPAYFRPAHSAFKPQVSVQSGIDYPPAGPDFQPAPIPIGLSSPPSRTSTPKIHRPYSPYNVSRPKPRKGFVRRIQSRIRDFLRLLLSEAQKHPLRTGILAILPIATATTIYHAGKAAYDRVNGWLDAQAGKKGDYGGILDEFVGFGGSRMGPLDGALKVGQMFVNHYCKLTPSSIPRILSIFLELYFLKDMVVQVARKE